MKRTTLIAATSASLVALGFAAAVFAHAGGGPRAGEAPVRPVMKNIVARRKGAGIAATACEVRV